MYSNVQLHSTVQGSFTEQQSLALYSFCTALQYCRELFTTLLLYSTVQNSIPLYHCTVLYMTEEHYISLYNTVQ